MPALRALLPRTKENSLTWARPAATIHLMYWLVFGRRRDKTSAARTNCKRPVSVPTQAQLLSAEGRDGHGGPCSAQVPITTASAAKPQSA